MQISASTNCITKNKLMFSLLHSITPAVNKSLLFIYSASEHPFTLQSIVTALHIVSGISHVFICFKKISLNFQTTLLSCAVYTSGTFQVHCRQPLQTLCLLFISNGKCKIITTYILSPQPAKKRHSVWTSFSISLVSSVQWPMYQVHMQSQL